MLHSHIPHDKVPTPKNKNNRITKKNQAAKKKKKKKKHEYLSSTKSPKEHGLAGCEAVFTKIPEREFLAEEIEITWKDKKNEKKNKKIKEKREE